MSNTILIAGATGNLGDKLVDALVRKKTNIRAIVRPETDAEKIERLRRKGVEIFEADLNDKSEAARACAAVNCVVSTLSGLREVIVDAQKNLLDAAVEAKVPRFIPSVFSLDFTDLISGTNRNLDLRREFNEHLKNAPIRSTSIFNGAYTDLLTTDMPLILYRFKRILYWGEPTVKMDLTHTFNVAEFTACAALDDNAPEVLRIAGDSVNAIDVREIMNEITGKKFKLFRAGSIGRLNSLIKIIKFFSSGDKELYPAWQGMQYMRDMMEGRAVIDRHDNARYKNIHWISVKEFLSAQNIEKFI